MGLVFLGTSTTASLAGQNLENSFDDTDRESTSSYMIGAVLFSAIFACALALACCQIKDVARRHVKPNKVAKVAASSLDSESSEFSNAASSPGAKQLLSTSTGVSKLIVLGRASSLPATSAASKQPTMQTSPSVPLEACGMPFPAEPAFCHARSISTVGSPVRRPTLRSMASTATLSEDRGEHLLGEPGDEVDEAVRNWVGSAEWAAARASRKRHVEAILRERHGKSKPPPRKSKHQGRQAATGEDDSVRPPCSEVQMPPAPDAPPPRLNVLRDDAEDVAHASAAVSQQLCSTAMEEIGLRKKTFKALCAKWHPDKNVAGDIELATEVFQYLQAQKAWYLCEQAIAKPSDDMPNA